MMDAPLAGLKLRIQSIQRLQPTAYSRRFLVKNETPLMSIEKLRKLLPVPASPIDTDESFLAQNIESLKTDFPEDYLEFSRVYGSGAIITDYRWEIYSAFRSSLPNIVRFFYERNRKSSVNDSEHQPISLFPEQGGLLPFGRDDDLYFTWRTSEKVNDWKVVVMWRCSKGGYQEFGCGFTEFLVQFLSRDISVEGYTLPWNPKSDICFDPKVFGG